MIAKKKLDIQALQKPLRNYGLDILRIFSMINIINLHINLFFGLLHTNNKDTKSKILWRLEIFSFFPVNCFGLISGVIGYKKYKFSKLIYLWFIALYYSILKFIFNEKKNTRNLIVSFLPLLNKFHWYMNAYFIMYLIIPYINYGINYLDKNLYRKLIIFFFLFFSIYHIVHILLKTGNYSFLSSGYSAFWLMILYIIGGYLGKYILVNSLYFIFPMKISYIIIYFLSSFVSEIVHIKNGPLFINYLSPTIFCQAISLLIFFSSLRINNSIIIKIINFITPLNFSVTFLHMILFQNKKIHSEFEIVKEFDYHFLFFKVYGLSILIYIFCIIIDFFRQLIFKVLYITKICQFLENKIMKL